MKTIQITIDGKKIKTQAGKTILAVAKENGIDIPFLCAHMDLKKSSSCRVCVVEIKGEKELKTACSTKIKPGMDILTETPKLKKARKINLELVFAQHCEECDDCVWNFNCQLLKLAKRYNVKITRFKDRKTGYPNYDFGPSIHYQSSKCIECGNCIEVCKKQAVCFLEMEDNNNFYEVTPSKDPKRDCIYCGQCIVHCPVGAFEAIGEYEEMERLIKDKKSGKTVVVQFAPSIRASIGEEFNMPYGSVVTNKLVAGIRALGVDKVFDTSVGADFTTFEEAKEWLENIEKGKTPCLTSCCPAWVKYVEFNYPEFIGNIASTRSPQMILGGLIKTYWAESQKIDPKNIVVVSIMPCVSKKYEVNKKELLIDGLKPVDYVLTTRELAYLFKKYKIDLRNIKPAPADNPLGAPSGSGVIYGVSGGVAEAALRTAYHLALNKHASNLEFKAVRGAKGIKKASIKLGKKTIRIAVANGIENAKQILEELKKNPKAYHGVEVMACFGGCIGGGGQPVPTNSLIREKRAQALYDIDAKQKLKAADENPIVKKVYKEFLTNKEIIHKICHTS